MAKTGSNIIKLREAKGYSVRELQSELGFDDPQAIYKWQKGKSLPRIDNLVILSVLFETPIERILVVEKDQGPFDLYGAFYRCTPAGVFFLPLRRNSVSSRICKYKLYWVAYTLSWGYGVK